MNVHLLFFLVAAAVATLVISSSELKIELNISYEIKNIGTTVRMTKIRLLSDCYGYVCTFGA